MSKIEIVWTIFLVYGIVSGIAIMWLINFIIKSNTAYLSKDKYNVVLKEVKDGQQVCIRTPEKTYVMMYSNGLWQQRFTLNVGAYMEK